MVTINKWGASRAVSAARYGLLCLAALPGIYVFLCIQYGGITFPFWDHTELIKWIVPLYEGKFELASLWAPHNHTRPLLYRAVMLINARLTDWDLRSEYVYLYLAIFGAFACHLWNLRKIARSGGPLVFPASLLAVSIVLFSPVGHNNHWWTMMLQLDATNLLIALGMLTVFLDPHQWKGNVLGALACWLASYTLTNGLIAFLAVILTLQMSRRKVLVPGGWTIFWAVNFIVLLIVYLPGLPITAGGAHPGIGGLIWFALAYLGMPLAGIIWFPYQNQFDIPLSTLFSGLCGCFLVLSAAALIWHGKKRFRDSHPAALILVGFTLFAGISALVTGWGRGAFDDFGIANANSSRYTIFGAYLLLGQIYYLTAGFAEGWLGLTPGGAKARWAKTVPALALSVLVVLGGITYYRATHIYLESHNFNIMLSNAYLDRPQVTKLDRIIHPNQEFVGRLKKDLYRLRLGPYRYPGRCGQGETDAGK